MTVRFAHDGKSGLRSALTGQHDLVLVCETLPELAGLQLTKRLRTHFTEERLGRDPISAF